MLSKKIEEYGSYIYRNKDLYGGSAFLPIWVVKDIIDNAIEVIDSKTSQLDDTDISVEEVGKQFLVYQKTKKILKDVEKTLDKIDLL